MQNVEDRSEISKEDSNNSLFKGAITRAALFAAAIGLASALRPENAVAAEPQKIPEPVKQTDAISRIETARTVAESTQGRETLITLGEMTQTEFNSQYLAESKTFMEKNEHLRGEARHLALESYLNEYFSKIQTLRQEKVGEENIIQVSQIIQATYHEFNSLVRAGEPEDIVRAAIKTGLISREHQREVVKSMFRSDKGYRIDLGKMEVTVDKETVKISEGAIFAQIIGNAPIETPIGVNEGTVLEGLYDMEKVDPEAAAKIQKDRATITQLVENYWPSIESNLKNEGVDLTINGGKIKEAYVEALISGQEQSVFVESEDGRKLRAGEAELEQLSGIAALQAEVKEFLGTEAMPNIILIPEAEKGMNEAVARVSADLRVIGGHISFEQLCHGNYSILIDAGNFQLLIDRETVQKFVNGDHLIIFDRLLAVPPMPAENETVINQQKGQGYAPGLGGHGDRGREVVKEQPVDFQGKQTGVGFNKPVGPRNYKSINPGRLGTPKRASRVKVGKTDHHSGKQRNS